MATIAEQLAAAAVTDSLLHAAMPSEAEWPKLAWAASRGTDSTSGWKPPGYVKHEPDGSQGGWSFAAAKQSGGKSYCILQRAGTFGQIGGAEFRQFSVWLYTTGAGTANGYQLTAKQSTTENKFIFRLAKYVGGVQTLLAETGELTMSATGSFAIVAANGKISAWVREEEGKAWTLVTAEVADATYTEGFSGVDGNGSNPTLKNFATGVLVLGGPNIAIGPGGGTASGNVSLKARTFLVLGGGGASAGGSLLISAKTQLPLDKGGGKAGGGLSLTAPVQLTLDKGGGLAGGKLVLSAPVIIALGKGGGVSGGKLDITLHYVRGLYVRYEGRWVNLGVGGGV